MKLREMPKDDQPAKRMLALGPAGLSQRELLAVVLTTGTRERDALELADALLARCGGLTGLLRASVFELCRVHGVGVMRALQIKAALEMGRRSLLEQQGERPQIKTPADAAQLLMPEMAALEQEEVRALLLDTRGRVLAAPMIYRGSLNSASMRMAEIFKEAVRANAASLILVHNHPSGSADASSEDLHVTREVIKAGKLLEVQVLDHIIIGHNRYSSLREQGLGFDGAGGGW